MITTIEEAREHARSVLNNADFVAVLPDGHIYLCATQEDMDAAMAIPEAFQVKPEIITEKKVKKSK